ncbi:hypothetical protein M5K25_004271 [Dendrobium thyrsiflorum]|uniref:Uncharacterized protein n=1 Tax=Dendrobium thyrsiflorum TaxID=117978 RepID=A0ABD0VTR5_DENTH
MERETCPTVVARNLWVSERILLAAMEDSGFHLHTSMDNNIYNLIIVTRFPSFDTSARMSPLFIALYEHGHLQKTLLVSKIVPNLWVVYRPSRHRKKTMVSPIRYISSNEIYLIIGFGFPRAQAPVGLRILSIKDSTLSPHMGLARREKFRNSYSKGKERFKLVKSTYTVHISIRRD